MRLWSAGKDANEAMVFSSPVQRSPISSLKFSRRCTYPWRVSKVVVSRSFCTQKTILHTVTLGKVHHARVPQCNNEELDGLHRFPIVTIR
jgi:hypothetical protein